MSKIYLAVPVIHPIDGVLNDVHEYTSPYRVSVSTNGWVSVTQQVGTTSTQVAYYSPSQVIYVEV